MKRIAAPMIGGMVSSTILTLIVIPALYFIWKRWIMRSNSSSETTFASPRHQNRRLLSRHSS